MTTRLWFLPAALLCVAGALYSVTFHAGKLLEGGPVTWLAASSLLLLGLTGITTEIQARHRE